MLHVRVLVVRCFYIVRMNTLCKTERLHSKIVIEKMFARTVFTFVSNLSSACAVYMSVEQQEVPVSILISVPKAVWAGGKA